MGQLCGMARGRVCTPRPSHPPCLRVPHCTSVGVNGWLLAAVTYWLKPEPLPGCDRRIPPLRSPVELRK
eukprot:11162192-Alexandrium_andersonii.AAC.1